MAFRIRILWENFFTMLAVKWSFTSVDPHMVFRITIQWKHFFTMVAFKKFSPVCILICITRSTFFEKAFSQWLHLYIFFSACVTMSLTINAPKKALSQWLQWDGLSSVCVLICPVKSLFLKKALLQWLHWNSFSPVCVLDYCYQK